VAVVQISKIQVRRGRKNSVNGSIPTLSSAEFAWAVDTQELFIGNGSVAEGAPYVGNTKILTEHDNILELASSYRFASDDVSFYASIPRSLQSKIDETVSVLDFGAVPDGSTDCTDAFEQAFTALFRNVDQKYRKTLLIPNGHYLFTRDLQIPSFARIRGETRQGARLLLGINNIRLITATGSNLVDFSSTNRPESIELSNLTINRTSGQTTLSGLINGRFENVTWSGEYDITDVSQPSSVDLPVTPSAVVWVNSLAGTVVSDTEFIGCRFENNSLAVKCRQEIFAESKVYFTDCEWFNGHTGIFVEGVVGQLTSWVFKDSMFDEIYFQAFRSTQGRKTEFNRCRFTRCGNGNNEPSTPITNIIYFGDDLGNIVLDCSFDRQQEAAVVTSVSVPAIAEVYNSNLTVMNDKIYSPIFTYDSLGKPLMVLSAFHRHITVNYILRLGSFSRTGKLSLSINDDLNRVSITDHYQYSDTTITSEGGSIMTGFEFGAELLSNGSFTRDDVLSDSSQTIDTVAIVYKNPTATGKTGDIIFDVSYGV